MIASQIQDGLILTKRSLLRIPRVPETLMFATIQPILFVFLFAYVFGGAVPIPGGGDYKEFLLPGIFVQTVSFATATTAVGLAEDMSKGLVDRFRSLPIARSAVLVGRTTADLALNLFIMLVMTVCGLLVGWRVHTDAAHAAEAYVLIALLSLAMSWIGALIGMSVRSPEVASS
ncbi:MAG: type transport system permease protein, partial [Actinomycetota bacterium]|nr:type transport system permease protein [Actinomycetota bacterium]